MRPWKGSLIALLLTTLLLASMPASLAVAAADDPLVVSNALWDANNAHAIDAALALFADDAVLQLAPPRATRSFGKAGIRTWLAENTAGHNHSEVVGTPQVAGDKATFAIELASDVFRAAGISPVPFAIEIVVTGGKIESFTAFPTAETAAKLARLAAPPAAAVATDSATVLQRFIATRNRYDIPGALALVTDDIRRVGGHGAPKPTRASARRPCARISRASSRITRRRPLWASPRCPARRCVRGWKYATTTRSAQRGSTGWSTT